jgi:DNA-binding NarL/FixJ family response regulator
METKIKLLLADDHALVLNGLVALLSQESSFEIVATARNGREAIEKIKEHAVDIALLDIDMPEMTGLEATRIICEHHKSTKVLLLSMHAEPTLVQSALDAGAEGYVLKTADLDELTFALKQVYKGKRYFDSNLLLIRKETTKIAAPTPSLALSELTSRENEILKMIAQGLNNNEIGERLFISPKTVDTHRTNLMRKLNAHNVASLTRIAMEAGVF